MDLGTAPLFDLATAPVAEAAEVSRADALLDQLRDGAVVRRDLELVEVRRIAAWALEHTVDHPADASTLTERGLDTGLPLAGVGAPLISDFAVMELAAVLGRSLDSGRSYVGQVVELSHRLPRIWAIVLAGLVPVWRALRIADATRALNLDAVAHVDQHLSRFAATCSWAQIDRLVDEALTRFDPVLAEERRVAAAEHRRVDIHLDHAGTDGVVPLDGSLDLADALDLEQALRDGATALAELGNTEPLDVRRSLALGEMARRDLTLDVTGSGSEGAPEAKPVARHPGRTVSLSVHLPEAAVTGVGADSSEAAVGRLDRTHTPVTAEQVRAWCGTAGTILVRPVVDVAGHEPASAYEIAERQARQVLLRDRHCIFPNCTRPAESCDLDHAEPHADGGVTCPCNLAPLCRSHHRLKTHRGWTYDILGAGIYHWHARTGDQWLITPGGTYRLDTRGCPGIDTGRPPDQ